MSKNIDERVVIRCTADEKKLYRVIARAQGRTMSGAVRYALRLQAEALKLVKPVTADNDVVGSEVHIPKNCNLNLVNEVKS